MKKTHLFLLPLIALLSIFSTCKDDDISVDLLPPAIKNYLDAKYPGYKVDEIESETLCTGLSVTEVEIENTGDVEIELTFDSEGTMIFTSTEIKVSQLPGVVSAAAAAKYPNARLVEAEQQNLTSGGMRYEIEVKIGKSAREALFESNGTFVCDQEEVDDDE